MAIGTAQATSVTAKKAYYDELVADGRMLSPVRVRLAISWWCAGSQLMSSLQIITGYRALPGRFASAGVLQSEGRRTACVRQEQRRVEVWDAVAAEFRLRSPRLCWRAAHAVQEMPTRTATRLLPVEKWRARHFFSARCTNGAEWSSAFCGSARLVAYAPDVSPQASYCQKYALAISLRNLAASCVPEPDMWSIIISVQGRTNHWDVPCGLFYYSPGGIILPFNIDDVRPFGRDLPELSVDNDFIHCLDRTHQPLSDRTTAPVTITLTPSPEEIL